MNERESPFEFLRQIVKSGMNPEICALDESDLLMWPQTTDAREVLPDPEPMRKPCPYNDWWDRFGYFGGPT